MNDLGKSITRKLGYSFGANAASLFISVLTVSVLPKYMTMPDYGLYQLFLFYFSYVGFLHFGVLGGAIVRYSGCTYSELDFSSLKSQCVVLFVILCMLSTGIYVIEDLTNVFTYRYIIFLFIISMLAQHIVWYCIAILQMSNRIEDASRLLLWERVSWGTLSVGAVFLGFAQVSAILFVFCITRIVMMIYSLTFILEIVKAPLILGTRLWHEFKINFTLGFPITLSDICSLLIIGIIRFAISNIWDLSIFAKTSLMLSITFFFLSFVTSASTVLLPVLRQLKSSLSHDIYLPLNKLVSYVLLIVLMLYYPAQSIIAFWLPQYADTIIFMGILFPVVFFESKFNLLIVTYLKEMLKTKIIFYINMLSTCVSVIGCVIFSYYMHNLELSILLITIVLGIKYSLGELAVGYWMNIKKALLKEYLASVSLLILFEFGIHIPFLWSILLYAGGMSIYTFLSQKEIGMAWRKLRNIIV